MFRFSVARVPFRSADTLRLSVAALAMTCVGAAGCSSDPEYASLHRATPPTNVVDDVVFEAGNWTPHLAAGDKGASWGNHRAVVEVSDTAKGDIKVTIPWRRRDADPSAKGIVVVDAATGRPVNNATAVRIDNVSGDVVFEPVVGSSSYHVYYMPWQSSGGYYPTVSYLKSVVEPDPSWLARVAREMPGERAGARVTRVQSVDEFHAFFPMEVIATPEEHAAFMGGGDGWVLTAEHRDFPVRMRRFIPKHWADRGPASEFAGRVLRDEYFTFQVAVVAGREAVGDIAVSFEGFPDDWTSRLTCFNCGGVDLDGETFAKDVSVAAGEVLPLWIGVAVPADARAGRVSGSVVVSGGGRRKVMPVSLDVDARVARNHGFDEPELQSRLAWLNSTVGTDPDFIIAPFTPVAIDGPARRGLAILGRRIELGAFGLPEKIQSYFTPELTELSASPEDVLARPLALAVRVDGRTEQFRAEPYQVVQEARGRASWTTSATSDAFSMRVNGALEYDGMLDYTITIEARRDVAVDDIALPVAYAPSAAEYMLGLGRRGSRRPDRVDWTWKVENHQEGVWLGAVNKGLQYVLRDQNYVRPLNTNFYQNQPLNIPSSWFNEGRGGIRIDTAADAVTATNYSGPRRLSAGETLHFNVRFLITPFKPIDTAAHFNTRFVHKYVPVDEVIAAGGTVVNIHHANEINPYINYPFFNLDKQTAYITEAHQKGVKVKLYDTIRELTYKAHELFPMRSFGDEIFNDGEGGGHSWLQEHLEDRYHSAWHAYRVDDAAILNKGTSRWTNYYVEGLAWLADHQKIDGLYLDDIAFSRETVRRMISVLHKSRDEVVIDLHSANQFNPRDGHINSAMLYMEHFPYMSRLWFGEYFEYDQPADYWMTEVSGLPFGLMGEMLQDGGHPYRGLLYGMTTRFYGTTDPRPVWKMMTDFGIADSRMRGYWLNDTPVRTGNPAVLATTYIKPEEALIALASWSTRDETVALQLDLQALSGGRQVSVYAPAVEGLQAEQVVDPARVVVPAGQGLFLRVR
jgi:hypothetical protein